MKKLVLFLFLGLLWMNVSAQPGDVMGVYYSTSINTFLNGEEIDSINIGGQTLISAEDMHYYSFSVEWNADERTLSVDSVPHAVNGRPPHIKKSNYPDGAVIGEYYETDIVTYLDSRPIAAYNIGGRTYIHAEEMRDFGYEVIWDEVDRNLFIKSPDRAGYVYDIGLSQGKAQATEGIGGFSLKYTPEGIIGLGDAEYFTAEFHSHPTQYSFEMKFYQNEGLFKSEKLLAILNNLCSTDQGHMQIRDVCVSINGYEATTIEMDSFRGNGHVDFVLYVSGIPKYRMEEINELSISLGEQPDSEAFEIVVPETDTDKLSRIVDELLLKHENDHMMTYYQTDEYFAVYIKESRWLGQIDADRLYLVNRKTWECSNDILESVRAVEGFDYGILNPFDFKVGDIRNNLFFGCVSPEKNGNFYVELDSGTVHQVSEQTK